MSVFDLPAKASALCMKQFNGEYGCSVCYHPGLRLPNGAHVYLPGSYDERTHTDYLKQSAEAEKTNKPVKGIVQRSSLVTYIWLLHY